jgi:hypothetical protein
VSRRYQGFNHKGHRIVVITGEKPKTMTIIDEDGSMHERPYEELRTGELTPVPQMPKDFVGFTDDKGNVLS